MIGITVVVEPVLPDRATGLRLRRRLHRATFCGLQLAHHVRYFVQRMLGHVVSRQDHLDFTLDFPSPLDLLLANPTQSCCRNRQADEHGQREEERDAEKHLHKTPYTAV